jgi:hypothetical protein
MHENADRDLIVDPNTAEGQRIIEERFQNLIQARAFYGRTAMEAARVEAGDNMRHE